MGFVAIVEEGASTELYTLDVETLTEAHLDAMRKHGAHRFSLLEVDILMTLLRNADAIMQIEPWRLGIILGGAEGLLHHLDPMEAAAA